MESNPIEKGWYTRWEDDEGWSFWHPYREVPWVDSKIPKNFQKKETNFGTPIWGPEEDSPEDRYITSVKLYSKSSSDDGEW